MSILRFLEAAPHIEPLADPEKVTKEYRYWRLRIFYSMFIGYAFFYFSRKSFTFAMPAIARELDFSKGELGIVATILSLTYGLSKFVSGIQSDRSNARYFMALGLILTGILNLCFGLSSSIALFALFWGLNGWFQGWGWPPVARLLTHWYSQNERGRWWSSWNVSHNIGGALIPLLAGYLVLYGWRYALFVPGLLSIVVGLFLLNRLRDTPQSLGLPPVEIYRNDRCESLKHSSSLQEGELTTREILVDYVIKNPSIWLLSIAYFFVYVVRIGVNDWSALFLVEEKGYGQKAAIWTMSLFEIGGFFGSLAAGWFSDFFFRARRGPINVLFSLGMFLFIVLFRFVPEPGWTCSFLMFGVGFLVFGPQMMIGMACAELSHKKAAATATGFAGWFAYLGAAFAGYPLGYLAQEYGWNGFFWAMSACCFFSVLLLLPLWGSEKGSELEPQAA